MLWAPKLSLSNIHVRLTAKGLLRIQLLSGCRKNTVVFQTGLSFFLNHFRLCGVHFYLISQSTFPAVFLGATVFLKSIFSMDVYSLKKEVHLSFTSVTKTFSRMVVGKVLLMLKGFSFKCCFFSNFKHIGIFSVF